MTLEKKAIVRGFSAAANTYDEAAQIQYEAALHLLAQIKKLSVEPQRLLDIGCGTGRITSMLAEYWRQPVTAIDCAPGMIAYAQQHYSKPTIQYICADVEDYVFPVAQYDLIFSNFSLQWCLDFPGLLKRLQEALTPHGLLAFTLPGEQTLTELKTLWCEIDNYDHINRFISVGELSRQLTDANMRIVSLTQEQKIHWHPNVKSIVQSLRSAGVHNVHNTRAPGLTGKQRWQTLTNAYEAYREPNRGLPMTYDITYILARKNL